jgi:hypothetical protein
MASSHWKSHSASTGCHHLSVLACVIKGKCIWMILEFEGLTCVDHVWPVGLPSVPHPQGLSMLLAP